MFLVLSRDAESRLGRVCEGLRALAEGAVPVARRERTPEPRAMRAPDAKGAFSTFPFGLNPFFSRA
jgi:hypothetical protein